MSVEVLEMKWGFRLLALATCAGALTTISFGYGLWKQNHGRADYANRYDLNGNNYPAQAGYTYNFGKVGGFNALPPGVNAALALEAVQQASNKWSTWGAIAHDTTALGGVNTGMIRLRYDPTKPHGAATSGYNGTFSEIVFGQKASATVNWTADNFKWIMFHEMGHTLGLDDWYTDYVEEFVDHPVNSAAPPVKAASAYRDNVMNQYNATGNNYAQMPSTGVDNDEIAGLIWLWGSALRNSMIVTGNWDNAWNGQDGRDVLEHHGHRTAGWWTYLGSISPHPVGGTPIKPYVDLQFPGFTGDFEGESFGTGGGDNFEYVGHQGNSVHRFRINTVGFTGNFRLKVKSKYTTETRINAWVSDTTGGTDSFTLNPSLDGAVFLAPASHAKVYGPVPEPATILALATGLGLLIRKRRKSG